ncbi:hypothetical protein ACWIDJ_08895, partial [Brevundimonas naejangsanensis]
SRPDPSTRLINEVGPQEYTAQPTTPEFVRGLSAPELGKNVLGRSKQHLDRRKRPLQAAKEITGYRKIDFGLSQELHGRLEVVSLHAPDEVAQKRFASSRLNGEEQALPRIRPSLTRNHGRSISHGVAS